MIANATFGLDEVVDLALKKDQYVGRPPFGAIGRRGRQEDLELIDLVRPEVFAQGIAVTPSPMDRMFGTGTGQRAVQAVGNETRTLAALQRLSVEIMAKALDLTGVAGLKDRLLVLPSKDGRPPILMLMSPAVQDVRTSRIISHDLDLPRDVIEAASKELDVDESTPEAAAFGAVRTRGASGVAELFLVTQPEVVLTRRPRMIPLSAPSPHIDVDAAGEISTVGVFCRDETGELGVTACHHGTGGVGTSVRIGPHASAVKHANAVQDIVFIPLDNTFNVPPLTGRRGVLRDREPAKSDRVRFDGATNQNRETRIFGTDNGLLRARPTVQLKLQTAPDTDRGDSGSALIDDQDRILGFAFERTDLNDYPQFTDWIWAANALGSLKLVPI